MGINHIGTHLAATASLALAAPAFAQDQEAVSTAAPAEVAAQTERNEVVKITREQCLAIADRDGKISCLTELRAQREAETAAIQQQLAEQDAEITALDNAEQEQAVEIAALDEQGQQLDLENAATQDRIDKGNTTIRGLTKVAALQEERGPRE